MRKGKGRVGNVCPRGSLVRTPVPRVLRTDCALAAGRSVGQATARRMDSRKAFSRSIPTVAYR